MKALSHAAAGLFALVVVVGCTSTEITEHQPYKGESSLGPIASSSMISRATPPMFRPDRRSPPNWLVGSRRPRSSARSAAS